MTSPYPVVVDVSDHDTIVVTWERGGVSIEPATEVDL